MADQAVVTASFRNPMTTSADQTQSSAPAEPADRAPVRVAVVNPAAGERTTYAMFELLNLTLERAFLRGPLFFEVDEEFSLELSLPDGRAILTRVRVVRLERGAVSGMEVAFGDLGDVEAAAVAEMVARWGD